MPYFAGRLQETNGEQEYYHDNIISAKNLASATKRYENYARRFYDTSDGRPKKEDGGYWHNGGTIFVEVVSVRPTTKEEWMEEQFESYLLKGGS